MTCGVSVAFEPAAGYGERFVHLYEWRSRLRGYEQPRDRPDSRADAVGLVDWEFEGEGCEQPARLDRAAGEECARGIEDRSRRGSEHHDRMVAVSSADAREPSSGPLECCGIVNRNEAEVSLRKPLLEEQQRVGFRRRRTRPEDLVEAVAELGTVTRHGAIVRRGIGQRGERTA